MIGSAKPAEAAQGSFLTGSELSAAIRHVLGGADIRCAVAFWGNDSDQLFDCDATVEGIRIVCDISMGGCNPKALCSLGAPDNVNIRYHDGLHAKVYLSDRGAVVGSANASNNGIGFGSKDALLVEAAIFHTPKAEAWGKASAWFDTLHSNAPQVDAAALERASRLYRPRRPHRAGVTRRPGSLLDMVIAEPDRFDDIGFVLSATSSKKSEFNSARRAAIKVGIDRGLIMGTRDDDMFIGWDSKDVRRWPTSFIELWMPDDKLHLYARTTSAIDHEKGNVFTKEDQGALSKMLPDDLPGFGEAKRQDAVIVAKILAGGDKVFRTATEFAAAIEAVTPL